MVNIEQNLLVSDTIRIPSGFRVPYVGGVNIRAGDGRLTRDGAVGGRWLIGTQDQANLFAYLYSEYGNYALSTARFYVTTLSEDGFYSPYYAYVERPSTVDQTITVNDAGGWFTGVTINLTDCQLQSVSKSADYTQTSSDRLIYINTSGGDVTITLPAANAPNANTVFSLVKTSAAHNLKFKRAGSDTLNGGSATLTANAAINTRVDYISDGVSAWTTL